MVLIDPVTAQVTSALNLDLPAEEITRDLTYCEQEKVFYTYIRHLDRPILMRIKWDGKVERVVEFSYKGQPIEVCEALEYDTGWTQRASITGKYILNS